MVIFLYICTNPAFTITDYWSLFELDTAFQMIYNKSRTVQSLLEARVMGKIDLNKKMKERSLLNTAFEFFTTKGFSKTSISDIVNQAGVAKGTFYLYFRDKYDIRNKLISHKSSQLFRSALESLNDEIHKLDFDEKIIRIADNIINQLNEDKSLLTFISKNLSWGVFKTALTTSSSEEDINFLDVYYGFLDAAPYELRDPEIMLFMIVELISSTCYSAILYDEPCGIGKLKPHLYETIRLIIRSHRCDLGNSGGLVEADAASS